MGKMKIKEPKDKFYTHVAITACMIVKNEADNIRRCLNSIAWCDEIVVVDTGSTDDTMSIIRNEYPKVQLSEFRWEGNFFSKCRNHALSLVKTNWTLIIDADEEWIFDQNTTPESLKAELLKLPTNKVAAVKMQLEDWVQGQVAAAFKPCRLFAARSKLRYKSTVHNEPKFKGQVAVCGGIRLYHYGYDLDAEKSKAKVERTVSLLKARLDDDPKDFEAMFYLMQIYSAYHSYQDKEETMKWAEVYFKHLPEMDPGFVRRNIFYSATETARRLKDLDSAERWAKEGKARFPDDLDLNYTLMLLGIDLQNPTYVIEGAQSYINRYRAMEADPLVQSAGFVFTKKPVNLLNVLHKLGLMRLQEGIGCLMGVDSLIPQLPGKAKVELLNALQQELKMIGCESLTNKLTSNKIANHLP